MVSQVLLSMASQGPVRASNVFFPETKQQNPKNLKITFIKKPRFVFNLSIACVHICGLLSVGSGAINLKETDKVETLFNKLPTNMTNIPTGVAHLYLITTQF